MTPAQTLPTARANGRAMRLAGASWVLSAIAAGAVMAGACALVLVAGPRDATQPAGESAGLGQVPMTVMLVAAPMPPAPATPDVAIPAPPAPAPVEPAQPETALPEQTPPPPAPPEPVAAPPVADAPAAATTPPPKRPPKQPTKSPAKPPKAPAQSAPSPEGAPPSPAAPSAGVGTKAMADYGARVMQDIRKTRPAAFAGQGAVTVGFVIAPSGALAEVRVLRSSGRNDLDAIATDLIHRAAPFEPPPAAKTARFSYEFMAK